MKQRWLDGGGNTVCKTPEQVLYTGVRYLYQFMQLKNCRNVYVNVCIYTICSKINGKVCNPITVLEYHYLATWYCEFTVTYSSPGALYGVKSVPVPYLLLEHVVTGCIEIMTSDDPIDVAVGDGLLVKKRHPIRTASGPHVAKRPDFKHGNKTPALKPFLSKRALPRLLRRSVTSLHTDNGQYLYRSSGR